MVKLRGKRVELAGVLCSQGASPRRPRVCSFFQRYWLRRAHTVEAACAPLSFETALGVLRCHGELIAAPHAEVCTQWCWCWLVGAQRKLCASSSLTG